jgi:hypothetical protein
MEDTDARLALKVGEELVEIASNSDDETQDPRAELTYLLGKVRGMASGLRAAAGDVEPEYSPERTLGYNPGNSVPVSFVALNSWHDAMQRELVHLSPESTATTDVTRAISEISNLLDQYGRLNPA